MKSKSSQRRSVIKALSASAFAMPLTFTAFPKSYANVRTDDTYRDFPSISISRAAQVVRFSHFDLEKVRALVNEQPELARASYDWAFGDWETAIGAASHVGRIDIIDFLIENGARPTHFTHTALGQTDVVKAIVEAHPGIEKQPGPHGISLLAHAQISANNKDRSAGQLKALNALVEYLERKNAEPDANYLGTTPEDLAMYTGDYMYGNGAKDGVSIKLNRRNMIALGRLGTFGGGLFKIGEHRFVYNGTPSTEISFDVIANKVVSLSIHEPTGVLKATRVET